MRNITIVQDDPLPDSILAIMLGRQLDKRLGRPALVDEPKGVSRFGNVLDIPGPGPSGLAGDTPPHSLDFPCDRVTRCGEDTAAVAHFMVNEPEAYRQVLLIELQIITKSF